MNGEGDEEMGDNNGWSDVSLTFTRLEAVTLLKVLMDRFTAECGSPLPTNQVHCAVLKAMIDRIWTRALR